jgi:hypothetical protein
LERNNGIRIAWGAAAANRLLELKGRKTMTKLRFLSGVVSALCLSMGVASADELKPHAALKGHPHLIAAEKALHEAVAHISKSQEANECVFGLEGGHGQKAKEAIVAAEKQVWDAAEWVNTHEKDCKDVKPGKGAKGVAAPEMKGHPNLKGHGNMISAEKELIAAFKDISKSQEANECVFAVEGGHGKEAKEAIDAAFKQVTEAAEYTNTHEKDCKGKK